MQRIYAKRLMIATLVLILVFSLAFALIQGGLPF